MQCCECHIPEPERFECENDDTIIRDGFGRKVMHAAAREESEVPEQEMLLIGSVYVRKEGKADRAGVLHDLCAVEVMFNAEKRRFVEVYLEMCTSTRQMCWSSRT